MICIGMKGMKKMIDMMKMREYFHLNWRDFRGKFYLEDWLTFCKEWDDACNRIRANAGKVKKHGR